MLETRGGPWVLGNHAVQVPVVGDASRVDRETICIEIVCRDQHNYFTTLNGDSSSSVSFNRVGERKKDNKKRSKDKTLAV